LMLVSRDVAVVLRPRPPTSTLFPTRRSSDLILKEPPWKVPDVPLYLFLGGLAGASASAAALADLTRRPELARVSRYAAAVASSRSEEHTSALQSRENLVCRLLLEQQTWRPRT